MRPSKPVGFSRVILALVLLGSVGLLPGLGVRDHWSAAEGRGPAVARDIIDTGRVFPIHLGGEPYLNKPPLFHLLVAASFTMFGETTFAARLPSAAAAILTALLTAWIVTRRAGSARGFVAGAALLATGAFFLQARSCEMETLLALAATLVYAGHEVAAKGSSRHAFLLFALGGLLATLTKGPVLILLFFALPVAATLVLERRLRWPRGALGMFVGIALALVMVYGPLLADSNLREMLFERAAMKNVGHKRGMLYYIEKIPVLLLPAGLFLPMTRRVLDDDDVAGARRRWLVAAAIGFIVFSCSRSKQTHYLLPLMPLLAASFGVSVSEVGRKYWTFIAALLGVIVAGGLVLIVAKTDLFVTHKIVILLLLTTLGFALSMLVRSLRATASRMSIDTGDVIIATLTLFFALSSFDAAIGAHSNFERSSALPMQMFRKVAGDAPLGTLDSKPTVIFDLGRGPLTVLSDVDAAREFLANRPRALVLFEKGANNTVPAGLDGFRIVERWTSPSGKRGWVLLGN